MVGILLCTYNGDKNIEEQIESILAQTYDDFILFISDDGSSDTTNYIIDTYISCYSKKIERIELEMLHNGPAKHFLRALQYPKIMDMEYIMLADQDDVWKPNKVEETLKTMKVVETEIQGAEIPILVHCDSNLINNDGKLIAPSFAKFANYDQRKATFSHLLIQNSVTGASLMMNRYLSSMLRQIPKYCVMHDHWIALVAAAFGKIEYVDKALYQYRQHINNVLGANEGGLYTEVFSFWGGSKEKRRNRKDVREQVGNNYREMMRQAICFKEIYGNKLNMDKSEILNAYISIQNKSALSRVITLLKYHITCDNWYRIVGECLFFLRNRISLD